MRTKKQIDITNPKLNGLDTEAKALYFTLLLSSTDAGIIPLDSGHDPNLLFQLMDKGLIVVTPTDIILKDFISSNYGPVLKPDYNPHKPILQEVSKSGYTYNPESNEIEAPENSKITDLHSLIKLCYGSNGTNTRLNTETTSQPIKTGQSKILSFIGSIQFALFMSISLMVGQSVHTTFTLHSISNIPEPYNTMAAIFTALIMDFLIIFFVINGKRNQSAVFFGFCFLMNLYSYHITTEYFTYQSFFAIVVSFAIPYAVHSVSGMVDKRFFYDQIPTHK